MERPFKGNLVNSFRHAFEGLGYVLRTERNARVHLAVALVVVALSAWLGLSALEWALIVAAIALVFAGEMLNTVIELLVDLITREEHPLAKYAKDAAAGAILLAALASIAIGLLVLGPHLWARLSPLLR